MISLFEVYLVLGALFLAIAAPALGNRLLRRSARWFHAVARRRWLAIGGLATLVLAIEVSVGLLIHMPQPAVHDEFAYLLTADTFAHGRLTNPTHPMWEHFVSFHIFHQPTYQAKYPPAQGAAMAVGEVLFGQPIVGVWLSVAAACAAVCWMLYGWLPPRWALLGGVLAALHPGILVTWGQSYWGGAIAMLGGALVFGALPRIIRSQRPVDAIVMGIGLGVLANSRPYEGLVASIPVALVLLAWWIRKRKISIVSALFRVAAPMSAVLLLFVVWMGYYNLRVTQKPLRLPYEQWLIQQGISMQHLLAGNVVKPAHSKPAPRSGLSDEEIRKRQEYNSRIRHPIVKLGKQFLFYFGIVLGPLVLVVLPWLVRKPWMLWGLGTIVAVVAVVIAEATVAHPHYSAPVAGLLLLVVVQSLRYVRMWTWRHKPSGRFLVRAIPLVCAVNLIYHLAITWRDQPYPTGHGWSLARAAVQARLEERPGKQLVIVHYNPDHERHFEWVYNEADIDGAKVVWARELGPEKDARLFDYFKDRDIWRIEPDVNPTQLHRVIAHRRGESPKLAHQ